MTDPRRPVMLTILDGWGWREEEADNAVRLARTPVFDRLWQEFPRAFLKASGKAVGLPEGQMGNSEVGHLNIGAGRVVMQELPRIGDAVESGSIAREPAFAAFVEEVRARGGVCHLLGLVSDGGVHAHMDHALGVAKILCAQGLEVVVHIITDGRDTAPRSGAEFVKAFVQALPKGARVGSVSGRYYAMDRDNRWERVSKAYFAMVKGQGAAFAEAGEVLADAYSQDVGDEFVVPAVVGGYTGMKDGDGIFCFNFRADRVREIMSALVDPAFSGFERGVPVAFSAVAGMTHYSDELAKMMKVIFSPQSLVNGLGEVVAAAGRKQVRMAETEKYPHVTYFFNGGVEQPYDGEDRVLVASPKVATYDLQPEMSAVELTDKAVAAIESGAYDLIVLNFANPDMVGHTGIPEAVMKAVETVDSCLGRIAGAIEKAGGAMLVTADHGNCELMKDPETGGPHTAHTTNLVPVVLMGAGNVKLQDGKLADLAPTLLALMGIAQPAEMTGETLVS